MTTLQEIIKNSTLNKKRLESLLSYSRLDTDRKKINAIKKEEEQIQAEKNQKPVESMTLSITWKKSKTWGSNPHCEAAVIHTDKTRSHGLYSCSGCGYDKESTVIADAFNQFLKYRLHAMARTKKEVPYGVHLPGQYGPNFSGGIGTNCYFRIAEFIGGKFEQIASGKGLNVYRLTMKKGR